MNNEQERDGTDVVIRNPDHFLRMLVDMANTGLEVAITLNVGGTLITGYLASERDYFDAMSGQVASIYQKVTSEGGSSAYIGHMIKRLGRISKTNTYADNTLDEVKEDSGFDNPAFIHLRDTQIVPQNSGVAVLTNQEGVWWRGQLGAVDGFILGSLIPSP